MRDAETHRLWGPEKARNAFFLIFYFKLVLALLFGPGDYGEKPYSLVRRIG